MQADNALKLGMYAHDLLNFKYTKFHNNLIVISTRNLQISLKSNVYQDNKKGYERI